MRKCNKVLIAFLITLLISAVPLSITSYVHAEETIDPPSVGLDGADEKNNIRSGSNSSSGSSGPSVGGGGAPGTPSWSDINGTPRGGSGGADLGRPSGGEVGVGPGEIPGPGNPLGIGPGGIPGPGNPLGIGPGGIPGPGNPLGIGPGGILGPGNPLGIGSGKIGAGLEGLPGQGNAIELGLGGLYGIWPHNSLNNNYYPTMNSMVNSHLQQQMFGFNRDHMAQLTVSGAASELGSVTAKPSNFQSVSNFLFASSGDHAIGVDSVLQAILDQRNAFGSIVETAEELGHNPNAFSGANQVVNTVNYALSIVSPITGFADVEGLDGALDGLGFTVGAFDAAKSWRDYRAAAFTGNVFNASMVTAPTIPAASGSSAAANVANAASSAPSNSLWGTIAKRAGIGLGIVGTGVSAYESYNHFSEGNYLDGTGSVLEGIGSAAFTVSAATGGVTPVGIAAAAVGVVATGAGLVIRYREPLGKAYNWAKDGIVDAGKWVGDKASKAWESTKNLGNNIKDGWNSLFGN